MWKKNKLVLSSILLGLLVSGGFFLLAADPTSVSFRSWESQTTGGHPVYNEIRYFLGSRQDVWMMRQSRAGLNPPKSRWDRLAIVVDKTTQPPTAEFRQLPPGELAWDPSVKAITPRVSCLVCHVNGPRAIRPDANELPLSVWDQGRVLIWNLRIKAYGRVRTKTDVALDAPLAGLSTRKLGVKTCRYCHRESPWGRGELTARNRGTIEFMVKNGQMPPLGFWLGRADQRELDKFLAGF
ncbi:MAG: hypothetical protein AB7F66_09260 [Bacteriovoracia bacterium]